MKRTLHNLSHYHLTSFNLGELIPIGLVETLPGDLFQIESSSLIRVTPQLKPLMHPIQAHIHHFYVPNRITWSGWEDFITGASATPPPTIGQSSVNSRITDYMGMPTGSDGLTFNALPIRAYNKIYNEYYRDKDIITEVGEDQNSIQKVAWGKDYFTSARPTPQQGTAVSLPLGTRADVKGIGVTSTPSATATYSTVGETGEASAQSYQGWKSTSAAPSSGWENVFIDGDGGSPVRPDIYADLSNATAATIAELREAFALQKYAEARAMYGDAYVDYLRYLGIKPSDSRIQRPEYLAGGRQTIAFSEVLNTSNTNTGEMVGHGIGALRSNKFRYFCEEHGFIVTMMFLRPKSIYVNCLPRKFSRTDKEDYFTKELEGIGAQSVLNKEVYQSHTTPDGVFGYTGRYDEYRSEHSRVSAEFKIAASYDWHLGRIFASDPALNQTFIECDPTKRVFADQSADSLWVMANHNVKARRMISKQAWYGGVA